MDIPKTLSSTYKEGNFQIVRNKDPRVKGTPEYYMGNMQGMYSLFLKGYAAYRYTPVKIDQLRAYAEGNQSETFYKDYFAKEKSTSTTQPVSDVDGDGGWTQQKEDKRKGFMNVLWNVVSPASKILSKMNGMFMRAEYDIVATPSDPVSKNAIQESELQLWAVSRDIEFLKAYFNVAGLNMQEPEYTPETQEELTLYRERGGFKPEHAMYIEQATFQSLKQSTWEELKSNLIKDLVTIGLSGTKAYCDDSTGTVKVKYIDPKNAAIQYSRYHDHQDSEWAFHTEQYSISELLERGIPRHELENIAKEYSGHYGNPTVDEFQNYNVTNPDGTYKYDFYKVSVLEGEWIDCDTKQELFRTNKYGHRRVIPQEYGEKIYDTDNAKTKLTDIRKLYKASWVIGTNVVFDYGEATNYIREGRGVRLNYTFYRLDGKSITEQLQPIYDNFMILWLKYQNALAQAVNQGYAINYDAISSLNLGGSTASQEQIIKRFLDTGILIFKQTDTRGRVNNGNLPVYELKGGLGQAFTEFREGFNTNVQLTEWITGINPLALGSAQDPNMPVGTQEMAVASTNDTLKPILDGVLNIKKCSAKNLMNLVSIKVLYDEVYQKTYTELIGARGVEVLRIAAKSGAKYTVSLEAKPTDLEKKEIYESAKIQLQNGRDGKPGIDEADFFKIMQLLNSGGSLKLAEMVLQSAIRRKVKEQQAFALQTQKLQQDGSLQQLQQKFEGEMMKVQLKGVEDRLTLITQGLVDARLQQQQTVAEAELQNMANQGQQPKAPQIQTQQL